MLSLDVDIVCQVPPLLLLIPLMSLYNQMVAHPNPDHLMYDLKYDIILQENQQTCFACVHVESSAVQLDFSYLKPEVFQCLCHDIEDSR
jgi:hypothetical protein